MSELIIDWMSATVDSLELSDHGNGRIDPRGVGVVTVAVGARNGPRGVRESLPRRGRRARHTDERLHDRKSDRQTRSGHADIPSLKSHEPFLEMGQGLKGHCCLELAAIPK